VPSRLVSATAKHSELTTRGEAPDSRVATSVVRKGVLASVVATSGAMLDVVERVRQYAPARAPVVLIGATGTGKSLFARALHEEGGRSGAFVRVTAREVVPALAASQFFGHEAGAFTGAVGRHEGFFTLARGGTLLLDDFHLMHRAVQALLLRVVEEGVYRPVGGKRDIAVTCRLVFGVGEDLDQLVAERRLLADLRHRMGYCEVRLPPLAERREEIPALAYGLLAQCRAEESELADVPTRFGPGVLGVLEQLSYPGNVRQLKQLIKVAMLHARDAKDIRLEHLPAWAGAVPVFRRGARREENVSVIAEALARSEGNVARAARMIGTSWRTVARVKGEGGSAR